MSDKQNDYSNQEAFRKWSQKHYAEAMNYCQRKQLQIDHFIKADSRVLPPVLAVWKVELAERPKRRLWVIGGDVMMDHVDAAAATSARDVLRHFSLAWQLRADQLEQSLAQAASGFRDDVKQREVIDTLIVKAEALYDLYTNDQLWGGSSD